MKDKTNNELNKPEFTDVPADVIFVLLNEFADWEGAYISTNLNKGVKPGNPLKYTVKTMALSKVPVVSVGGFKVLPDYDLETMPD